MSQPVTRSSSITRRRTHLRPQQLAALQHSFAINPLPDSTTRHRLALDLGVTERTVQIWFQNRRAKARKMESLSISLGMPSANEDAVSAPMSTRYQATFRTLMTPAYFEEYNQHPMKNTAPRGRPRSSSKPEPKTDNLPTLLPARAMSEDCQAVLPGIADEVMTPSSPLVTLPVQVLRIGSWTRLAKAVTDGSNWDLLCQASPSERQLIWLVQAEGHQFRVQVPFDAIGQIQLSQRLGTMADWDGQLEIALQSSQLEFSMWRVGQDPTWVSCGDFTEGQEATEQNIHGLQGNHDALQRTLLHLTALAPELIAKIVILPALDWREMTLSPPPTTPETYTAAPHAQPQPHPQHAKVAQHPMMLQAPFFYGDENLAVYTMLQQQQAAMML